MDSLALKYCGYKTIKYEDVTGKGKNQINFSEVPIEEATAYAAEDADVTLRLHECLWPRLKQIPTLEQLFRDIELPLAPVLARMERTGVRIDVGMLRTQSGEIARRLLEPYIQKASVTSLELGAVDGAVGSDVAPFEVVERRDWRSALIPIHLQLLEAYRRVAEGLPGAASCRECGNPILALDPRRTAFCNDRERFRFAQRERRKRLAMPPAATAMRLAAGSSPIHRWRAPSTLSSPRSCADERRG